MRSTLLEPNLSEVLISNLGPHALKSRGEADLLIKELSKNDLYGSFGLRMYEKLEGDIDKQASGPDAAFLNALCGGRSDAGIIRRAHQSWYLESNFEMEEGRANFIYDSFGKAAPHLHYLIHMLGAFHKINHEGLRVKVWSPKKPRLSRDQIIVSGRSETRPNVDEIEPVSRSVAEYLTRLALCLGKCPEIESLPFKYIPRKRLKKSAVGDLVKLVG